MTFIYYSSPTHSCMKKLTYVIFAALLFSSCLPEQRELTYTIDISVDTITDGYAYLQKREDGEWVKLDSALAVEGVYGMQGNIDFPSMHYVYISDLKRNVPLFLDHGNITIELYKNDNTATKISGSAAHDEYKRYESELSVYDERIREIYSQYKEARELANDKLKDSLSSLMDQVYEDQHQFIREYVLNHNAAITSPYIAYRNSYLWDVETLEEIVNNFDPALQASPDYKYLSERITTLRRVAVGQPLVDFVMKDTSGADVRLSEISKGKYMLVDFWASWCGPCRAENPNIVACYRDFHEKGFDILGVSFDSDREKWIKAIHDDSLYWNHVSDLQYWNNAAGKLYGIRAIPSSILLDPDGIIIGKDLRGEDLRSTLNGLMPE